MINEYFASGKIYRENEGIGFTMTGYFHSSISVDRKASIKETISALIKQVSFDYDVCEDEIHIETLTLIKQETTCDDL